MVREVQFNTVRLYAVRTLTVRLTSSARRDWFMLHRKREQNVNII